MGLREKEDEPQVDTTGMSKFEKGRYECSLIMVSIREDTRALDTMDGGNARRKAELSNRIRRNLRDLKTKSAAIKKDALHQGKGEEYTDMIKHVRKTETMYKQRFRGAGSLADDVGGEQVSPTVFEPGNGGGGGYSHLPEPSLDEPLLDPADDEEFQMFYQECTQRNQAIDQGLVRVQQGLGRLKNNALETQAVLEEQNALLDDVNMKAEKVGKQLKSLNGKLKHTLKEVEQDKYCCYIICLLLVLGVAGVLLTQTGVISK
eukprot:TRINITY_DN9009_c0_g3_i1.p1 TRINITY_DN9009_c0_g3~~TRINITY_DN9009_c0_g3_i1.p1  ORF type:complete len:300 (+),score=73.66 TRINITY_DN9009_c0_g3_i1:118-900(+)